MNEIVANPFYVPTVGSYLTNNTPTDTSTITPTTVPTMTLPADTVVSQPKFRVDTSNHAMLTTMVQVYQANNNNSGEMRQVVQVVLSNQAYLTIQGALETVGDK